MANAGAPKGNKNATKNKLWQDALQKELSGNRNQLKLRKIAKKLIAMAEEGDIQAIKEIGDRLDGKPAQAIIGDSSQDAIQVTGSINLVRPKS